MQVESLLPVGSDGVNDLLAVGDGSVGCLILLAGGTGEEGYFGVTYTVTGESVPLLDRREGFRRIEVTLFDNHLQRVRSCEAEDSRDGSKDSEPHRDFG